jgi:hypothetical protein
MDGLVGIIEMSRVYAIFLRRRMFFGLVYKIHAGPLYVEGIISFQKIMVWFGVREICWTGSNAVRRVGVRSGKD